MNDDTPREKADAPAFETYSAVATWFGDRLAHEAAELRKLPNPGPETLRKMQRCDACAMRMRAIALDYAAADLIDPGNDAAIVIRKRFQDAQAEAEELTGGRFGQ